MQLGHVAISVGHLQRSISFYRTHFGLQLHKKYVFRDKGMTIALLKKNNITLELFEFKKHKPLPQYRKTLDNDLRTLGVKHFSLETKDITAIYNKFRKSGVRFATDLRAFADGRRYFFIKDPNGILIEVMSK